jgi:hypothetical protein
MVKNKIILVWGEEMKIEQISKSEYENENCIKIPFFDNEYLRSYARISFDRASFVIAWGSESIQPEIIEVNNFIIVGVDNKVLVFDSTDGIVDALFPLRSYFFHFLVRENCIVILSELEIIVLDKEEYSINQLVNLPDILEDYVETGTGLGIKCMDGRLIEVVI